MTVAFTCCGSRFRVPHDWVECPVCLRRDVRRVAQYDAEPRLEEGQWEADGVIYSDAFMPVEWAERLKS